MSICLHKQHAGAALSKHNDQQGVGVCSPVLLLLASRRRLIRMHSLSSTAAVASSAGCCRVQGSSCSLGAAYTGHCDT